jgi:hypothetical protein
MATRRVDVSVSSPSTEFVTDADIVSQNQAGNYSTVYYWTGAVNQGGTSSFDANNGVQASYVAGIGGGGHAGTIPSGVPFGATRWYDGPYAVNLAHDAAGNRGVDQVAQSISWSWNRTDYGTIGPYPRIPKPPSIPGRPVASNILPTSVTLTWAASTDNGGSAIDSYLLRRWTGTTATGPYVDVHNAFTLSFTDTGLQPGTNYTYAVYAHNGSAGGYSPSSLGTTVKTLAPAHVRVAGIWKYAVPYVKVTGVWKQATPWVKVAGVWKQTG